jgi:hypothetical protein
MSVNGLMVCFVISKLYIFWYDWSKGFINQFYYGDNNLRLSHLNIEFFGLFCASSAERENKRSGFDYNTWAPCVQIDIRVDFE